MAGHNKWSKVKRLTGALDAKRGKLFSKLAKENTLAARTGDGSPEGSPCPYGAMFFLEAAIDNKNQTTQELRLIFPKHSGHQVRQATLGARADEVAADDEHCVMAAAHGSLYAAAEALQRISSEPKRTGLERRCTGLEPQLADLEAGATPRTYISENHVTNNEERLAAQFLRLSDALTGHDGHQPVHATAEIADDHPFEN